MNDDLQSALATNFNDLAAWVKSAANATGDFIAREAPLFVQEYVAWVFWSNAIPAAMLFLLLALSVFGIRHASRRTKARREDGPDGWFVLLLACAAGCVIGAPVAWTCTITALKAKIAPRVLLVEKAAELAGVKK